MNPRPGTSVEECRSASAIFLAAKKRLTWTQPNHPFTKGQEAKEAGQSWGANPYDPENEEVQYEHWLDGWSYAG